MSRLDPKNDVVFKFLLTREPSLLIHMLEGILACPIEGLELVDPAIPRDLATEKHIALDIRAVLADGRHTDLEMQMRAVSHLDARLLYYFARNYSNQLRWGDQYHLLTPTIGIAWLGEPLFPWVNRLHSIFEIRERHSFARYNDHFSLHILQLTHLQPSNRTGYAARVERWARFLLAKTDEEFERLAREDPVMQTAKQTLDALSMDPDARRLAQEREDSMKLYRMSLVVSEAKGREEGRREGREVGRAKGRREGRAEVLLELLGLRFGPLPEEVGATVESATRAQLDTWIARILTAPSLEAVLDARAP